MMAIRVLLDHGVPASQIIFCTFLVAADGGVHHIQEAFPGVRMVTGAVDGRVVEAWIGDDTTQPMTGIQQSGQTGTRRKVWNIEPGMGHIGTLLDLFDTRRKVEKCLRHRRTLLLMRPSFQLHISSSGLTRYISFIGHDRIETIRRHCFCLTQRTCLQNANLRLLYTSTTLESPNRFNTGYDAART